MTEDPFAAPSSAPHINKIPFLVFDAILVITAVALAFSAGGPLSPLLFFWILLCVVVGGLVGCLPFWIEFRDKVRLSEYEIRERQNSIHDSQWQYVDARLVEQNEYLQKLHLRLSDSAERLARIEARPPTPTADEVAALCSGALQKQWPTWREELLTVLSRRTDILFNEQNAHSVRLSASHEKRLGELRKEFTAVETVLRGLETRVGQIALLSAATGTAVAASHSPAGVSGLTDASALAAEETPPTQPALDEAPDAGEVTNAAGTDAPVAGTILDSAPAVGETSGEVSAAGETLDNAPAAAGNEQTEAVAESQAGSAPTEDSEPTEDAAAAGTESASPSATADSAVLPPVAEPSAAAHASAGQIPPAAAEQPALLRVPEVPERRAKAASTERTTLIAQVLIGIGNKPYVRGIGPGLSLEKGVPMQFVEIGKWEWVCPSGTAPVKILIYKNDEIPSSLGEIELEPGQRKAVTPTFAK